MSDKTHTTEPFFYLTTIVCHFLTPRLSQPTQPTAYTSSGQ